MSEPTQVVRVLDDLWSGLPSGTEVLADGRICRVRVHGELVMATRGEVIAAVAESSHPTVLLDIAGVSFMDCSGYGGLVTARLACEAAGRRAYITGWTGQPAHLRDLIALVDGAK